MFSPFSKWRVYFEAVPVDGCVKVLAGVLGGAGAQAVEAQGVLIVVAVPAVLAAGVQLAEHQLPVVALLLSFQSTGQPRPKSSTSMDLSSNRVTMMRSPWPSRASSMALDMISNTACSQPSSPSEPKMTAGALADPVGPF